MPDVFTKAKRSLVMSRIRSSGNRNTELAMIKVFQRAGITGWRRKQIIFGKPDFVFKERRLAVFVDGCFWHVCPKCYRCPSSNKEFWIAKHERNMNRDRLVTRVLRSKGWFVLRIWEHELKSSNQRRLLNRIKSFL